MYRIKNPKSVFSIIKKLTFLDLLILLSVLFIIITLFFYLNPEKKWVSITVVSENSTISQALQLKKDDFEVDSNGNKVAVVKEVDVRNQNSSVPYIATPANINRVTVAVEMTILANINRRNGELSFKNRMLKSGSNIELRLTNAQLNGVIAITDTENLKTETKNLTFIMVDQPKWFVDTIQKDSPNLKDATSTLTNFKVTPQSENSVIENPLYTIEIKLRTFSNSLPNGLYISFDQLLFIGRKYTFTLGNVELKDATLVSIE